MDLNPANYPNMGMSRPLGELMRMRSNIIWYDTQDQAEFADAICRRYAQDAAFCELQLKERSNGYSILQLPRWNTTSIANSAFMALHSHAKYKHSFMNQHKQLVAYLRMQSPGAKHDDLRSYLGAYTGVEPVKSDPTIPTPSLLGHPPSAQY